MVEYVGYENAAKPKAKPNWIKRIVLTVIGVPVAGFILLFVAAAVLPSEKKSGASAISYYELRELTENAIRSSMNEPASTQFRNVRQGPTPDVVCGEVNARNGFGGYGAFRRFYARSTPSPITPQMEIEPSPGSTDSSAEGFDANYHSNCGPV